MAAAAATPIPIRQLSHPFFESPFKRRKQRRLIEKELQQRIILEAEEESRSQAWNYVVEFLHTSEWCDQLEQIAVNYDAMPTMVELESYGALDEKEGTRACRKLFKAPVVWDELGRGLWKVLSTSPQHKAPAPVVVEVPNTVQWRDSFGGGSTEISNSTNSSRRSSSRRSSEESCATTASRESASPRMTLSSSPGRQGSVPRMFSRLTARRC
ncbi:hypothetical protein AAL_03065 [Moelleriella libera RCEF 2490]|uniref:Uncharacterized protein n=1 Tax=Moelleriella libera RCEF 2490 TaxID=1081109 RepID=A0A168E904_9HYPO|nr:hypothetical protein AAL_03065 [Moelleriella libera RCEF 2490]